MRAQWCREHIEETAENCGLEKSTVSDVKQAAKFCASNSEFTECSTDAIITLIRVKDEDVKNKAISLVKNALIQEMPNGGKKNFRLTKPEVRKFVKKAEVEVRGKMVEEFKKDTDQKPASPYQPQPNSIPVTNDPAMRPLSEIADLSKLPQLSPDAPMDEVMKRDELLLKLHNVPSEFKTGSEIQKEVINGGIVTRPAPYKITPEPMSEKEADELILQVVNRRFTPKSKELWETILASGELSDSPARLFEAMVCRIGGE
jgi:hypothetical protein